LNKATERSFFYWLSIRSDWIVVGQAND